MRSGSEGWWSEELCHLHSHMGVPKDERRSRQAREHCCHQANSTL